MSPNFDIRAVVWTAETGTTDLGGMNSRAIDINNRGVIAGEVQGQAVIWTDIGVWQELGILGDSPFGGPRFSTAQQSTIAVGSWEPARQPPEAPSCGPRRRAWKTSATSMPVLTSA